jgi:thiol-disulfide isomerase/thioredoxin
MYSAPSVLRSFLRLQRSLPVTFIAASLCVAQTHHIDLPTLTQPADKGLHLTIFSKLPKHALVLPDIDTSQAMFFDIFYSWKVQAFPEIAIMVVPAVAGELLYIDRNNNRDLRDDGPAALFPYGENSLFFDIICRDDPNQKTRILLQRRPELSDSSLILIMGANGNLNPNFVRFWSAAASVSSFAGKRHTFYFDDRVSIRRGHFTFGSSEVDLGLFDWSNNGLFNDGDDILLVRAYYGSEPGEVEDQYALNDVFAVGDTHLLISAVDKYGKWIELTVTSKPLTSHLTNQVPAAHNGRVDTLSIAPDFWTTSFVTIDGDPLNLRSFRGKFLLLNFWGEWCRPCVTELSTLVEADHIYAGRGLRIVSFLKSKNLSRARAMIREKGMSWPQILLTDSLEAQFGIRAYPTNILIAPDGSKRVQKGALSSSFLDEYIQ